MAAYKELDDFVNDPTEARADAYMTEFTNYGDRVAQTFPALNLSRILAHGEKEEVKERWSNKLPRSMKQSLKFPDQRQLQLEIPKNLLLPPKLRLEIFLPFLYSFLNF